MKLCVPLLGIGLSLIGGGLQAAAVQTPGDCAAMNLLLKQAPTDFSILRQRRMPPGSCSFRDSDFRCGWAFTGDAFGMADAQAQRLRQCTAAYPTAQLVRGKPEAIAFALDPDLTVTIQPPEMDGNGNWAVGLRIQSAYKPQ